MAMDKYKETFATWNKVAKIYQDKFMDLELYNDTYTSFCKRLTPTAAILELGCGPGNVTRHLLNYSPDFKVLATDMAPNMIELAKINVPEARFKLLDARELNSVNEDFDAIVIGFCLPYLSKDDCEKLLLDSRSILNKSGLIYLSFIEGNYADSGYQEGSTGDRSYVCFYEENNINQRLRANGFSIVDTARIVYPRKDSQENHIVIIAKKK